MTLASLAWVRYTSHDNMSEVIYDDYRDIPASAKLTWHPCFNTFLCAKLQVPMNHDATAFPHSENNPLVEIALILLPGHNHLQTNNFSTNPLLVNPGGPGASGVEFVRQLSYSIRNLTGQDRDIIEFDPRGVGHTKPTADCFSFSPGEEMPLSEQVILRGRFQRAEFGIAGEALGLVSEGRVKLRGIDDANRAKAKLCGMKDEMEGKGSILRYLDTQTVARNMLEIIDAWDDWRDSLLTDKARGTGIGDVANSTKAQLHYLGFSYAIGTYLGATFAAMFPNRVGRMVLDGVVDASQAHDPFFSESIRDTDAVYDLFLEYCAQAGPSRCDFAREGDDARTLRNRANIILEQLHERFLIGMQPRSHTPLIFTWSILHSASFGILYSPVLLFPILARIYDLLYREDYDELFASISQVRDRINPCAFCSEHLASSFETGDASMAIRCADASPLNASVAELDAVFQNLSMASIFADVYMGVGLQCNTWPIRPAIPLLRLFDNTTIDTSFPLLFVSDTHDPITPLSNDIAMLNLFKDTALVEGEGEGHCSIAEVSLCTVNKIRGYLQDGNVPCTLRSGDGIIEG
ncbi:hypothetical protein E4T50_04936 [Aureobasidium sp. EXF-12298]|nr:hypothetical protein E4T50_04936 [Aureobasidium sp. EXF-12298]